MARNFNARSVDPSHFAMIPRADVPRSVFRTSHAHKTTFDVGRLVPVYVDEVLPGDHFKVDMTAFVRMATLIFPMMDNLKLSSFFFFVPNRLVWDHWQNFMGERRPNPDSSVDYVIPQTVSSATGFVPGSIADYFGLPVQGTQVVNPISVSALPFRAYNLICNEWFRDENLGVSVPVPLGDGPDAISEYGAPYPRAKCHDYFTSALPWPQKGDAASVPLTGNAPVVGIGVSSQSSVVGPSGFYETGGVLASYPFFSGVTSTPSTVPAGQSIGIEQDDAGFPAIFADLSQATAVTINALRQSFQIQKLLERDARGGTRYTEILRAHFGVISPDARLQRPEYLGGGKSSVNINPVAQTASTDGTSPQGNLSGVGTGVARHGFSKAFVEHGHVIGLVCVDSDVTYQQGVNKMWSRSTRYDFYWPEFAHLGEQAVLVEELYAGADASSLVFGYQERYAEYRYRPSMISGMFRSNIAGTLDSWHLSQYFASAPTLNFTFIEGSNVPMARVLAAGSEADGQQFLFDSVFVARKTRPMPVYGVPGFIDRF